MAYLTGFNKYTIAALPSKMATDGQGGIYLASSKELETVLHLDKTYTVVRKLVLQGLLDCAKFPGNPVDPKYQRIHSISYVKDLLLVSLTDNTTVVVADDGTILNVLKTHQSSEARGADLNQSIRCSFKTLQNGKVLILAHSKFSGSILAQSTGTPPDFLSREMIDSTYWNDTYSPYQTEISVLLNMKRRKTAPSIRALIEAHADDYRKNRKPNDEHVHYVTDWRIWDVVEMADGTLLLLVFTNMVHKSHQPNKNMPYFLVKLTANSGEVLGMISPSDRAIFKLNLLPRFIINEERILFKTMDALYEISTDLKAVAIYHIPDRSLFKKLFPVAYDAEQIHFIHPEKGELFSYPNEEKLESRVDELLKSYRKQKKTSPNRTD